MEQKSDMKNVDCMQLDMEYVYGGKFTSQGEWIHPIGTYDTWEFIYMICGEAHMYEGTRSFTAVGGDCLLLRPGVEHGGYAPSTDTVSFFWLHGKVRSNEPAVRAAADTVLSGLPLHAKAMQHTQIPLLCRQLLHHSSLQMYPASMSDALFCMVLTEYAVHVRLQAMEKERGTGRESEEDRLVNDIAEYIRINARTPLTAADVALHFQYHEDYLTRLFRQKRGIGVKAYIDEMRIAYIRTLLLTTDAPLKSIAVQSGFDDYKAFLKYFTYHESITPTELRKRFYRTHTNNH